MVEESTTPMGKPIGAPRATEPEETRCTNVGPRDTSERHTAGRSQGTRTGAKQQRPPGATKQGSGHHMHQTGAREKVPRDSQPGQGRPPRDTLAAPAEHSARKATRTVGSAGPHARTPNPQPVGSRPPAHARRTGGWGRENVQPQTPDTEARGTPPPPSFLLPPQQRATLALKSIRCGVGDGPPQPHLPRPKKKCRGCGCTPDGLAVGGGRMSNPGHTSLRHLPPPPRAPSCPPPPVRNASTQEPALWGWSQVPTPASSLPNQKGQRPWAACPGDGRFGEGECPTQETPHRGTWCHTPRAPSHRPHSAQRQLARPCAVGLVTGPHACAPCVQGNIAEGPGCRPKRPAGWGRESAQRHETRGAPSWAPSCRPQSTQRQLARARAVRLVMGPHIRIPLASGKRAAGPGCMPKGGAAGVRIVPSPRDP